jgi:hypothetical protein
MKNIFKKKEKSWNEEFSTNEYVLNQMNMVDAEIRKLKEQVGFRTVMGHLCIDEETPIPSIAEKVDALYEYFGLDYKKLEGADAVKVATKKLKKK